MTCFKHISLTVFSLLLFIAVQAQTYTDISDVKEKKYKRYAKHAEQTKASYAAIDFYEGYFKSNGEDVNVAHKLGHLYMEAKYYKKAKFFFRKVQNIDANKYPEDLFYYALMLKMSGDYETALNKFEDFKSANNGKTISAERVTNEIEGCNLAIEQLKHPLNVNIKHLNTSVNKAHIEFAPLPIEKNKLLYASLSSDTNVYFPKDTKAYKESLRRKFYYAEVEGGDWVGEVNFDVPIDDGKYHLGNGIFSEDGEIFVFTKGKADPNNYINWEIYISHKEDGEFQEPVKAAINSGKNTTHPNIVSEDSRMLLYFSSNQKGGQGGMDIWYAEYDGVKKNFVDAQNAGSVINTDADEITPFYDVNKQTLYFSSNGLPGIGGFDVFKSEGGKASWAKPENIGYPVNSETNDMHLTFLDSLDNGFFVTNREGGNNQLHPTCCYDIYNYEFINDDLIVTGKIYETNKELSEVLEGLFNDDKFEELEFLSDELIEKALLEEVNITLIEVSENGKETALYEYKTTKKGYYSFSIDKNKKYKLALSKDGYYGKHYTFSTINETTKIEKEIKPLGLKKIEKKGFVLENIYYDYGKATLRDESKQTIDETIYSLMVQSPEIIAEISSHTDSVSSDDFNKKLSQKRAESVVNYLIAKGIDRKRMIARGYGEERPVTRNSNPDGSDNEEGRARNRRTEFKVIGSTDFYSPLNKEDLEIERARKRK